MNKIAVIIAAYNAEKYIARCIKSVQNQSYETWEIYVVNDGSTDNTLKIVMYMEEKDERIKVINTENGGVFKARRTAIDAVKGCKYMTFLDADDYLCDNHLFEKCINKMEMEHIDCLCFNYQIGKNCGFGVQNSIKITDDGEKIRNLLNRRCIDGNMPYAIYKSEIIKEYFKVYDYSNDDFLNKYDILLHSANVVYVPWCGYHYSQNMESQTHRKIEEKDCLYFKHVKEFTDRLLIDYPNLKEECNYFLCWVLLWTVVQLEKNKELKKLEMYEPIMKEFKKCNVVFKKSTYFSKKEIITYFLIRMHIFGISYRIYHIFLDKILRKTKGSKPQFEFK